MWEDLFQIYADKKLTRATDKFVAHAGLANEFHRHFPNDRYIAGLWQSRLPQCLLWEVGTRLRVATKDVVAPSWSWVSVESQIKKQYFAKNYAHDQVCDVVEVPAEPSVLEVAKAFSGRKLKIFGYIRRLTIHESHGEWGHTVQLPVWTLRRNLVIYYGERQATFNKVFQMRYSLDSKIEEDVTDDHILFISILYRRDGKSSSSTIRDLNRILLHKTDQPDTYRRIGMIRLDGWESIAIRYNPGQNIADQWEYAFQNIRIRERSGDKMAVTKDLFDPALFETGQNANGEAIQEEGAPDDGNLRSNENDITRIFYGYSGRFVDESLF